MTRTRFGAVRAVVVAAAVAVIAACTGPGGVDDTTLFAQIGELDGVSSADLEFASDITSGSRYRGEVAIDPALTGDAYTCTVRRVAEILWQGKRTSSSSVVLVHGEKRSTLGAGDLSEAYGPRPSEPRASATVSPCPAPTPRP